MPKNKTKAKNYKLYSLLFVIILVIGVTIFLSIKLTQETSMFDNNAEAALSCPAGSLKWGMWKCYTKRAKRFVESYQGVKTCCSLAEAGMEAGVAACSAKGGICSKVACPADAYGIKVTNNTELCKPLNCCIPAEGHRPR